MEPSPRITKVRSYSYLAAANCRRLFPGTAELRSCSSSLSGVRQFVVGVGFRTRSVYVGDNRLFTSKQTTTSCLPDVLLSSYRLVVLLDFLA
jgi:hypothetical protein